MTQTLKNITCDVDASDLFLAAIIARLLFHSATLLLGGIIKMIKLCWFNVINSILA